MAQPTPEQVKEFQEKVKNMSPEELKELQQQQCIFCQIVAGKVASKKVYEDKRCMAILDINPANPGHTLLMPKEHFPLMPLMPEDLIGHLFMVAKALSGIMPMAVGAEGVDIFVANGTAAGQKAQHFMLHVIPRKEGDKVPLDIAYKKTPKDKIDAMAKEIQERVNQIFKKTKEVVRETPKEENQKEFFPGKEPEGKPKEEKQKKQKKSKESSKEESGVSLDEIANLLR